LHNFTKWKSVVLRADDADQIRTAFDKHGAGKLTKKMMLQFWLDNKNSSGATWSEQLNWRDTLQQIKKAFLDDHFAPSKYFSYSPGFIESMLPGASH
jgi:hypothetical protein